MTWLSSEMKPWDEMVRTEKCAERCWYYDLLRPEDEQLYDKSGIKPRCRIYCTDMRDEINLKRREAERGHHD